MPQAVEEGLIVGVLIYCIYCNVYAQYVVDVCICIMITSKDYKMYRRWHKYTYIHTNISKYDVCGIRLCV